MAFSVALSESALSLEVFTNRATTRSQGSRVSERFGGEFEVPIHPPGNPPARLRKRERHGELPGSREPADETIKHGPLNKPDSLSKVSPGRARTNLPLASSPVSSTCTRCAVINRLPRLARLHACVLVRVPPLGPGPPPKLTYGNSKISRSFKRTGFPSLAPLVRCVPTERKKRENNYYQKVASLDRKRRSSSPMVRMNTKLWIRDVIRACTYTRFSTRKVGRSWGKCLNSD